VIVDLLKENENYERAVTKAANWITQHKNKKLYVFYKGILEEIKND